MTITSAKDLVAQANKEIMTLTPEEAVARFGKPGVVFIDVRETDELQKMGKAKGAVHTPRGMLEFQADPSSPTHRPEYEVGKELILYCGTGGRSALAAKALKDMGFVKVAHVAGGFPALQNAGMPID